MHSRRGLSTSEREALFFDRSGGILGTQKVRAGWQGWGMRSPTLITARTAVNLSMASGSSLERKTAAIVEKSSLRPTGNYTYTTGAERHDLSARRLTGI